MKQFLLLTAWLLSSVLSSAQGFQVTDFSTEIYLSREGYFDVTEHYDITFTEPKHGILRDILTRYEFQDADGTVSKRDIIISDISVPGSTFKTNSKWSQRSEKKVSMRIGDKDKLVVGKQHYEIRYRVKNAFIFTDSLVQFYWNIKGAEWLAIFEKIRFKIHAPEGALLSPLNCFVYAGNTGNSENSEKFDLSFSGNTVSGISKESFKSYYGRQVTVLVKLPAGMIEKVDFTPPLWQRYLWVLILLGIFIFSRFLYAVTGYKKKVIEVTSYYPPKGIDPAMAGFLIDDQAQNRDIISLLPEWGNEGLISMEAIIPKEKLLQEDLKLIKRKELPEPSPEYKRLIFDRLFNAGDEVKMSSLRNHFSTTIFNARISLMKAAKGVYYAPRSPLLRFWGWLLLLWAIAGSIIFVQQFSVLSAVINAFFSVILGAAMFKRKKNPAGNEVLGELRGFRKFIELADVDRIKALLRDDPFYFEKTMSYAVAFGMLDKWAAKFEGLSANPPGWYNAGSGNSNFTMNTFGKAFSGSMVAASSALVSMPASSSSGSHSSSGGGSSGGGFGGGGGSSW